MAAHSNFFNYAHSILTLMLWVLPINILVLAVWVHNLTVHWLTPFSSHHNVLSIMPFLLLVETMTTGLMIPRLHSRYVMLQRRRVPMLTRNRFKHVTYILLFSLAAYSAIYGVSYAYLLHHVANILAAWLVGIYLASGGFSFRRLWRILEGDDGSVSDNSGRHMKKKP
jgi:glycosylphosphatidylinositol deacylase